MTYMGKRIELYECKISEEYKEAEIEGMPKLYYKPEKFTNFGVERETRPTHEDLIYQYFVENSSTGEIYGYPCGVFSLNRIHGTTQMTMLVELVSNKVEEEREYKFGRITYKLYPAKVAVNNYNHFALEILDNIENLYDYFDEDVVDTIKYIVKRLNLKHEQFKCCIDGYSDKTKGVIRDVFA